MANPNGGARPNSIADAVAQMQANGYRLIPIRPGSKRPVHTDWRNQASTPADWSNGNGAGLLGGYGTLPVDIDTTDPEKVTAIESALPAMLVKVKGKRGFKTFFRDPIGLPACKLRDRDGGMLVELLSTGQAVVPPSVHPEMGTSYTYLGEATLLNTHADDLPEITPAHLEALRKALGPWLAVPRDRPKGKANGAQQPSPKRLREYAEAALQGEVDALAAMGKDTGRNYTLFQAACKLGRYSNHGVLTVGRVEGSLLKACEINRLLQDDGEKQCRETIASGLRKAEGDELPELEERADPKKPKAALGLVSVRASDRKPQPVDWEWEGRLAKGKVSVIAGEPGAGKSQALIDMIARITTGADWPNNEGKAPPGSVILLSAEDSIDDTIIPRLIAAGANLERVHLIPAVLTTDGERPFTLKFDLAALEAKIVEIGDVQLVGFDPLASYMPEINASQNADVRSVLDRLSEMADRRRVAVVVILHYRKEASGKSTSKAMHKVLDSIAFVAGPRVGYAISTDANDPERQLFLPIKYTLTRRPLGLSYRIVGKTFTAEAGVIKTSHVEWGAEAIDKTADQAIAEEAAGAAKQVLRHAILRTLEEADDDDKGMTPQEIADAVDARAGTVRERLRHMVADGSVHRDGTGRYWHPDRTPPMPNAKPKYARRPERGGTADQGKKGRTKEETNE